MLAEMAARVHRFSALMAAFSPPRAEAVVCRHDSSSGVAATRERRGSTAGSVRLQTSQAGASDGRFSGEGATRDRASAGEPPAITAASGADASESGRLVGWLGQRQTVTPAWTLSGPACVRIRASYRRIRGSPKCGKTLLSENQVSAEIWSPSSVRTSSPYGRAISVWGDGK